MFFPLGVVVRFRTAFAEHVTLRPYGQQHLKFCSRERKSLENTRRRRILGSDHLHRLLQERPDDINK